MHKYNIAITSLGLSHHVHVIPFIQNNVPFNELSVCSRAIHCASYINMILDITFKISIGA